MSESSLTPWVVVLCSCLILNLNNPTRADEIVLPPDSLTYPESRNVGFSLITKDCLICHSAEYVLTAPLNMSKAYWQATVEKMKKVFGAPFDDKDVEPIVEYLLEINDSKH